MDYSSSYRLGNSNLYMESDISTLHHEMMNGWSFTFTADRRFQTVFCNDTEEVIHAELLTLALSSSSDNSSKSSTDFIVRFIYKNDTV